MFIKYKNTLLLSTPIRWPPDGKSQLIGKDPDAEKDWRQEEKEVAEDEMVAKHHWLNEHEFEEAQGDSGEQRSLACHSPWSLKKLDRTQQVNNNSMMNDTGESDHVSEPVDDGNLERMLVV